MHNLCIPGPVVVLVRRGVNVISTLSIAQQYQSFQGNKVAIPDREHADEFLRGGTTENREHTRSMTIPLVQWAWASKAGSWDVWWSQMTPLERYQQLIQGMY